MEKIRQNTTVFVGMSGGVDSSVAALRLKKQGYKVVGVFIKVWHPDFMICNWEQERLDAMRVAAHLEIPFLTCNAEKEYKDEVADYFISEYKAGRTPNPDVMCNKSVKFGAFVKFAKNKGADYIATGHYAQRIDNSKAELHRGVDEGKDQTYFLWTLTQEQLDFSLFPVGDTPKIDIRKEAEKAGIPVANKDDSQGICFLGHVDISEFLSHYIDLEPGNVLDENGEVVGKHKGAFVYTLGQRQGFDITVGGASKKPLYVVDRDVKSNTLTVSENKPIVTSSDKITLSNVILRSEIGQGETLQAQFRYRQKPFEVKLQNNGSSYALETMSNVEKPASGQSCVLYKGSECIGGGMIC